MAVPRSLPWHRRPRGQTFFLVFNWGVGGLGRFSITVLFFLLRVGYSILLIKVIVILTNKKDFIIVGELALRGDNGLRFLAPGGLAHASQPSAR